ncbi:ribosomal L1 domain-containing protein 1 isoform X2 [Seriola lalandi dorsalis]|uniref:ribosomal L1 domain-containing protein 1 isoform X2 n=1 Tax=Seriola lalandi dorsalis TaxID=1841481 RepID=UPI000C6FC5EF|nr:ribosomal L1 domain-containing protein 1 isoform X2 [Seriola lalandi dorsalis]XP_056222722.1 ribosomal L1 domain-containing protein 1 isoform X2 [Seriola aureovittata]
MADKTEVVLDRTQVKKAVQALQAFLKTKSTRDSLLLDDTQHISLLFTLWKVPKQAQTIRIPLPHGQRPDTEEICLFTKDEPNMTAEQTQRFYKKLLEEKGVKNISEIIPYKVLRTEYKPYEAKRRLLGNFDLFLSDDRVRRLLPSHLGKHFYERKKEPLCVNLQSKHLARDIQRVIQGTSLKVTNKGCCCMARVALSSMAADDVTDNIEAAVKTAVAKLRMKGPVMKLIHIKSQTSVALPIYTSDLSQLSVVKAADKPKEKGGAAKKRAKKKQTQGTKQTDTPAEGKGKEKKVKEEEEEEIPQLVPIETPSKKPKLEPLKKKQLEKVPKPAAAKKGTKAQSKMAKKAGKTESKGKRKVPKVK